jgi:hypothetical protein
MKLYTFRGPIPVEISVRVSAPPPPSMIAFCDLWGMRACLDLIPALKRRLLSQQYAISAY